MLAYARVVAAILNRTVRAAPVDIAEMNTSVTSSSMSPDITQPVERAGRRRAVTRVPTRASGRAQLTINAERSL